jgi:3-isopropylmalate dehydrogenase
MSVLKLAIVAGDGIGPEVMRESEKVLRAVASVHKFELEMESLPYGAEHYLATGVTLPAGEHQRWQSLDGVLMGAFGDPRVPDMTHARDILLGSRFTLDLYVNLRPIQCFHERLNPLKNVPADSIDMVVLRENTEGLYVGVGGTFKKGTPDEIAVQEQINSRKGVERIIRAAFEYAKKHNRHKVTMSDKSNALRFGHELWLRTFHEIREQYPEIEAEHMYIDALAMQMVRDPAMFDVIVTCNLFGDIVTDLGAALQGGLGMAASANLNPGNVSLFEPVHGSAPPLAGKDVANPFGAILTAAMWLEYVDKTEAAKSLIEAVREALVAGECTEDAGGSLGTAAAGDAVVRRILA